MAKKKFRERREWVYMITTADELELPLLASDRIEEVAAFLRATPKSVSDRIGRSETGVALCRKGVQIFRIDAKTGRIKRNAKQAKNAGRRKQE